MTDAERNLMMAANAVLLTGARRPIEGERTRLQAAVAALAGDQPAPLRLLRDRAAAVLDGTGDHAELRAALLAYVTQQLAQVRAETPFRGDAIERAEIYAKAFRAVPVEPPQTNSPESLARPGVRSDPNSLLFKWDNGDPEERAGKDRSYPTDPGPI